MFTFRILVVKGDQDNIDDPSYVKDPRALSRVVSWPALPRKGELVAIHPERWKSEVLDVWHWIFSEEPEIAVEVGLDEEEFEIFWEGASGDWEKSGHR